MDRFGECCILANTALAPTNDVMGKPSKKLFAQDFPSGLENLDEGHSQMVYKLFSGLLLRFPEPLWSQASFLRPERLSARLNRS